MDSRVRQLPNKEDRQEYRYRCGEDLKYTHEDIQKANKSALKEQVTFLQNYVSELHFEIKEWKKIHDEKKNESKNRLKLVNAVAFGALFGLIINWVFKIF